MDMGSTLGLLPAAQYRQGRCPAMEGDTVYTACPTHAVCDRNQALAPTQEPARWKKAGVAAGVDFRADFAEQLECLQPDVS